MSYTKQSVVEVHSESIISGMSLSQCVMLCASPRAGVDSVEPARETHTTAKAGLKPRAVVSDLDVAPPVPYFFVDALRRRFNVLANILLREYVPTVSIDETSESYQVHVACEAEKIVVLQCAAELDVPLSMFDIVVDGSTLSSALFWLNDSALATAHADSSGQIAARLALYVLERSVLNGTLELWDLRAVGKLAGGGAQRSGVSEDHSGPRLEIRASMPAAHLATAAAAVSTVNALLHHPSLLVSAVLCEEHDLVGDPLPTLLSGAKVCVDFHSPASHPEYPAVSDAFITSFGDVGASVATTAVVVAATGVGGDTGVVGMPGAEGGQGAVAAVMSPQAAHVILTDSPAHAQEWVIDGFFTLGAYAIWKGSVYVVTAGHKLGRFATNAYLGTRHNPLVLMDAVNPPACSGAPTFFVANSSDAIPFASRVSTASPRFAVDTVVRAHADVSIFLLNRPASADELNMVPVPVHSREQWLCVTPFSSGQQFPFLGLVAFEDNEGPLWFVGCTVPNVMRRLFKVGVAKKRVVLSMPVGPVEEAVVSWLFTDIAIHDGKPESGPCPAKGDSGGSVMRAVITHSTAAAAAAPLAASAGLVVELDSFVCGSAQSGSGAALRVYYTLTPAHLALAQLNALPAFAGGACVDVTCTGSTRLEFCQPRCVVEAALAAGRSGCSSASRD
jgi:hypothetical protein